MSADNQVALSRMTRGPPGALSKATRQAVPPFLQKLYEMVSDSATDNLIRWSDNGESFFVLDHQSVAHDVLPRWFKHNNFSSFVRQLNMYGFHKIQHLQQGVLKSETETELWNFEHPNFHRGQPDLLCLITRKKQAPERGAADEAHPGDRDGTAPLAAAGLNAGSLVDINAIVNGISAIKRHQATISADLNDLKTSNQHLWTEAIAARDRHKKQEDTIDRILKFLAGVFGNSATPHKGSPSGVSAHPISRKRQRLLIESGQHPANLGPLEPLDGEDVNNSLATIETESEDGASSNCFADNTSPNPSRATPSRSVTPKGIPMTPEAPDAMAYFPNQTPTSLNPTDVLMGGNFPSSTSAFDSAFPPGPNVDPSLFSQSPNSSSVDANSMNALTSQHTNNQDVLQAILNSPGQLQRLLNLMNLQQQNAPIPPPLDLNASGSDASNSFIESFTDPSAQSHQSGPQPPPPLTLSNKLSGIVEPDSQTLSLLQPEDSSSYTFEPLLSNANQLQKAHKDAADISAEVDAMQASLDSLIQNLGLDPAQIASMHENAEQGGTLGDGDPVYSHAYPHDTSDHVVPGNSSPTFEPSLNPNTDNAQFQSSIPEFDFNLFINELARQQGLSGEGSTTNDAASKPVDAIVNNGPMSKSPEITAFVDEVTSQSDSSSPSMTRAHFVEDPVVVSHVSETNATSDKKGRKRKSDIEQVSAERNPVKSKRKR